MGGRATTTVKHKLPWGLLLFLVAVVATTFFIHNKNTPPVSLIATPILQTMVIQIPLLVDASNPDYTGPIVGCDKVVMVEKTVPKTQQPLNAALHQLFLHEDAWEPWNGTPSNFLSAHPGLSFDHAVVVGGVATIYIVGTIGPLGGVCDDPRLRTELEQTALQFPSVTSVKFSLNGAPTDLRISEK